MAYAGIQMFMGYLKQIINCNDIPFINNNPMILSERPQLQLLYQEFDSIIQTLPNIHHHHSPEKVRSLKKRFKDVAEEAQYRIDVYLSDVNSRNSKYSRRSDVSEISLDLKNVMRSLESINLGFMVINFDNMRMDLLPRINTLKTHSARDAAGTSTYSTRNPSMEEFVVGLCKTLKYNKAEPMTINVGNMRMDSSSRIDHVKTQFAAAAAAAGTSYTRNPSGIKKPSEDIVVGLHHDVEIIWDKLTEDTKPLCVVSIVGMGGLGKTTLATKLFNDPFIKYHFHLRAWATISQTYVKCDFLIQILVSIGVQEGLDEASDSQLREKLHKKLMGRRYLIVIDDIWSIEAWDELKLFFPHDNTGSRILLTTRVNEVALHVKPHGFVHSLTCLTEEESWELLKQKVFHGDECPEWLIKPGMQIAKKCHGLPLSVVVMAGVLTKEPMSKDFWENIACTVTSYILGDPKGCLEILALSYNHLPDHLRECFLHLGGFPEDFMFNVRRVIWLWVAEGLIEEAGNRSLEDTAKAYLMDLTNRNLVIVAKRNAIGKVKACKIHDLVRELCVQKAKEEGFFLKIDSPTSSSQLLKGIRYKQLRVFTNQDVNILHIPRSPTQATRSLLCFHKGICSVKVIGRPFVLLKVLDLQECRLDDFPQRLALLVQLRYLAIWCPSEFPESICELWSLQTLILKRDDFKHIDLPPNITNLVNLRHLWSNAWLYLPYIKEPMNLHSISKVMLKYEVDNFQKCFPNIKKLVLDCGFHFLKCSKNLELLPYLENLKLLGPGLRWDHIAFPATLTKLSLIKCDLPWSHMSIIQLLPNLEVLELDCNLLTTGRRWDACEQQFRQLKLLKLEWSNIIQWEASSTSFPCLKQLSVSDCEDLEEIPLEIGEIATLELIEIDRCSNSVVESVKRIQQEQDNVGNDELKITVNGIDLSFNPSQHGSSDSEW